MKDTFNIGGIEVERGTTRFTRLECSELADGTPLTIPLIVVHGKEPGPVVFIKGCQHGDEVIGALIARNALRPQGRGERRDPEQHQPGYSHRRHRSRATRSNAPPGTNKGAGCAGIE